MRDEFKNNLWTKRFLPHYNASFKFQMITYRLADSLPQDVLNELESQLKKENVNKLGAPRSDAGMEAALKRKRRILTEEILDKGYGSCLLGKNDVAIKQIEAWKYFHRERYELISYVVMPNHVHLLIKTYPNFKLGDLVWSWKKFVSSFVFLNEKYISEFYKHYNHLLNLSIPASERGAPSSTKSRAPENKRKFLMPASQRGAFSIWQREYWDRFIRDEKHFEKAISYIHQNPVKAGFVDKEEKWPYSSLSEKG